MPSTLIFPPRWPAGWTSLPWDGPWLHVGLVVLSVLATVVLLSVWLTRFRPRVTWLTRGGSGHVAQCWPKSALLLATGAVAFGLCIALIGATDLLTRALVGKRDVPAIPGCDVGGVRCALGWLYTWALAPAVLVGVLWLAARHLSARLFHLGVLLSIGCIGVGVLGSNADAVVHVLAGTRRQLGLIGFALACVMVLVILTAIYRALATLNASFQPRSICERGLEGTDKKPRADLQRLLEEGFYKAAFHTPSPTPGGEPLYWKRLSEEMKGSDVFSTALRSVGSLLHLTSVPHSIEVECAVVDSPPQKDGAPAQGVRIQAVDSRTGELVLGDTFWGDDEHEAVELASYAIVEAALFRCRYLPTWAQWHGRDGRALRAYWRGCNALKKEGGALEAQGWFRHAAGLSPGTAFATFQLAGLLELRGLRGTLSATPQRLRRQLLPVKGPWLQLQSLVRVVPPGRQRPRELAQLADVHRREPHRAARRTGSSCQTGRAAEAWLIRAAEHNPRLGIRTRAVRSGTQSGGALLVRAIELYADLITQHPHLLAAWYRLGSVLSNASKWCPCTAAVDRPHAEFSDVLGRLQHTFASLSATVPALELTTLPSNRLLPPWQPLRTTTEACRWALGASESVLELVDRALNFKVLWWCGESLAERRWFWMTTLHPMRERLALHRAMLAAKYCIELERLRPRHGGCRCFGLALRAYGTHRATAAVEGRRISTFGRAESDLWRRAMREALGAVHRGAELPGQGSAAAVRDEHERRLRALHDLVRAEAALELELARHGARKAEWWGAAQYSVACFHAQAFALAMMDTGVHRADEAERDPAGAYWAQAALAALRRGARDAKGPLGDDRRRWFDVDPDLAELRGTRIFQDWASLLAPHRRPRAPAPPEGDRRGPPPGPGGDGAQRGTARGGWNTMDWGPGEARG